MNQREALRAALDAGFVFDRARGFITEKDMARILQDSAELVTTPNAGVPAVMTTWIDPMVIEILTAPTNAREIFGEIKKGDWTDSNAVFRAVEPTGESTEYTDYGNGAASDINVNYPTRQNYLGQTNVRYGELEMAVSGRAMIDLAGEKQRAAANVINKEQNKIYLYGVANKEVYGLLNEPNIPAALTPAATSAGATLWSTKTTNEIYDDIIALAAELFKNSQGHIDGRSELVLCVPPELNVYLGKATDFNISVKDMLDKYFSDLSYVTLPELASESGNNVMLIAKTVNGQPTAQLGYSEKMRAFPLLPEASSWVQKFAFGCYGCILYRPFAVAVMTGC